MRKIVFIFFLALFVFNLNAQDYKHDISLGVGVWSTTEIVDIFGDVITSGLTGGAYNNDKSYSGAIYGSYKYAVSERWGVGGAFVYENAHANATINDVRSGKIRNNYYTLAAEADFKYTQRENLTVYGLVGAGATLFSQKYIPETGEDKTNNMAYFNFQVTPLGVKFGRRFGGYAELGFGYKGILAIGLFTRF